MADSTETARRRTGPRVLTGECKLEEHGYCRPGDVATSYGDVVLTIACHCPCHGGRAR